MEEEENTPLKNSVVSFYRRLSVANKIKFIRYAEERSIHFESNYCEVSWP